MTINKVILLSILGLFLGIIAFWGINSYQQAAAYPQKCIDAFLEKQKQLEEYEQVGSKSNLQPCISCLELLLDAQKSSYYEGTQAQNLIRNEMQKIALDFESELLLGYHASRRNVISECQKENMYNDAEVSSVLDLMLGGIPTFPPYESDSFLKTQPLVNHPIGIRFAKYIKGNWGTCSCWKNSFQRIKTLFPKLKLNEFYEAACEKGTLFTYNQRRSFMNMRLEDFEID